MAIDTTEGIPSETGRISYIFLGGAPIPFSRIFSGAPLFYPGSRFTVQEVLTIRVSMDKPELVDIDYDWCYPHKYLGSWQLLKINGVVGIVPTDEGFLNNEDTLITRYTDYTISANPSTPVAQHEQISLDNCNFYLIPDVAVFPPNPVVQPGFSLYDRNPALLGSVTLSPAPLADTDYFRKIDGIGLFLKPGVSGISLRYQISIVNDIYTDYPPALPPQCTFLNPDCQQLFTAFIAEDPTGRFPSLGQCEAIYASGGCFEQQFVCPIDPTQIFTFYSGRVD